MVALTDDSLELDLEALEVLARLDQELLESVVAVLRTTFQGLEPGDVLHLGVPDAGQLLALEAALVEIAVVEVERLAGQRRGGIFSPRAHA